MLKEISLREVSISKSGVLLNHPSALVIVSWGFPRPDMANPVLVQTKPLIDIGNIPFKKDFTSEPWHDSLLFRQNSSGKSVLKVEVATVQDLKVMGNILNGIFKFITTGLATMITSPIGASVFSSVTSELKLNSRQIIPIGESVIELQENFTGPIEFDLVVTKEVKIRDAQGFFIGGTPPEVLNVGEVNGKVTLLVG